MGNGEMQRKCEEFTSYNLRSTLYYLLLMMEFSDIFTFFHPFSFSASASDRAAKSAGSVNTSTGCGNSSGGGLMRI